jgi:hypothetical protein
MTTLRTFQNEIEDIHNRELAKQRAYGAEKVKENKNPKNKAKDESVAADSVLKSAKGKAKEEDVSEQAAPEPFDNTDMAEVEDKILV